MGSASASRLDVQKGRVLRRRAAWWTEAWLYRCAAGGARCSAQAAGCLPGLATVRRAVPCRAVPCGRKRLTRQASLKVADSAGFPGATWLYAAAAARVCIQARLAPLAAALSPVTPSTANCGGRSGKGAGGADERVLRRLQLERRTRPSRERVNVGLLSCERFRSARVTCWWAV